MKQKGLPANTRHLQAGQTLIEVLAALGAASVVIAAITVAAVTALNNAQFSRDQSQATQYAQEGIETMRNLRDFDIASISATALPDGNTYCMSQNCTYITSNILDKQCGPASGIFCNQNVGKFVRSIMVNHNDSTCNASQTNDVKVTAVVSWNDSKCTSGSNLFCHQVTLSTCLSDFTVQPTP